LPVKPPVKLPVKQLLLVLGVVATAYAAALLIWGDSPRASLARLWSWTGLQAGALCLLNYLLRGMRWRLWMAHYGRHFGWLQGLRLYLAWALCRAWRFLAPSGWPICCACCCCVCRP
jgi:hypothetical protein